MGARLERDGKEFGGQRVAVDIEPSWRVIWGSGKALQWRKYTGVAVRDRYSGGN